MNVIMLAPLPPPSGGIASWTLRYADYCESVGIHLRLVNIAMQGERVNAETTRFTLKTEIKRTVGIIRDLKKALKNDAPDIVHLNTSCSSLGVVRDLICAIIASHRVPVVLHCRCNIEDQLIKKISIRAFRKMVKKSTKVMVLNSFSKDYVDRITPGKTVMVPNFVDEKSVDDNYFVREEIREAIYVGHIERKKGFFEIIEVARKLQDVHFNLVGAVREDLSGVEIPENISLIGRVSADSVKEYLRNADVFLFPSYSEGFSNALLEAMAAGLPVIASNVGAASDMIESDGGVLLPEITAEEIAGAFRYLKDRDVRQKMSVWNVNKVKRTYLIDEVMNEYLTVYRQALQKEKTH